MSYIICFDSGLGGLTTLAALRNCLPQENFIYIADIAHMPYGVRKREEVLALTTAAVKQLLPLGVKALVLACNTATAAAVSELRQIMPFPVMGLEPAVKPALAATKQKVAVLGTELTLKEQKFESLLKMLPRAEDVVPLACPGLVELIEQEASDLALKQYLQELLLPHLNNIGAVVLGCTHYVYLRPILRQIWPDLQLFDGNQGLSLYLVQTLKQAHLTANGAGTIAWHTTEAAPLKHQQYLAKCQRFYQKAEKCLELGY